MAADELTRQDLQFAKQRIKALLSDRRKVFVAQGVSPVISALAGLADKLALARDNNGEAKPGWLYYFFDNQRSLRRQFGIGKLLCHARAGCRRNVPSKQGSSGV